MSFFDMIPSEYMMMPTGAHASRRVEKKNFGLLESKCACCGKTFYRRSHEVQYVRHKDGKEVRMCSWTHLCRWEEKNKRTRKRGGCEKTRQERISEFVRKMAADRALLDSEEGARLTKKERQRIRGRLHDRAKKVQELMLEMEVSG